MQNADGEEPEALKDEKKEKQEQKEQKHSQKKKREQKRKQKIEKKQQWRRCETKRALARDGAQRGMWAHRRRAAHARACRSRGARRCR